jgi:hypothetical protein
MKASGVIYADASIKAEKITPKNHDTKSLDLLNTNIILKG